nr:hypothetical protein GCM10020092_017260 [Actinoplanes digitatis]
MWTARDDARLDGGPDVVDVDVHVPGGRLPLAGADHDERVAEPVERAPQHVDRVGLRVEEVLHLVAEALPDRRRPARGRHQGLGRAGPGDGGRRAGPGVAQGVDQGLEEQDQAAPARVDHPGPGQDRELLRGAGQGLRRRAGRGARHRDQVVRGDPARAVRRGRHHREHRALDRLGHRRVRRLAGPAQGPGQFAAAHRHRRRERVGHAAQDLRHDDARVAPRAEQRAAGHSAHRRAQRRLPGRLGLAGEIGGLVEGLLGRGEGEHQVGAGVAVGHRVDVQLVDLVLVCAERRQPTAAPAAYRGGVQGVQHAKSVLTGSR